MSTPVRQSQDILRDSVGNALPSGIESNRMIATVFNALLCYILTSAIVIIGVVFGHRFLDVRYDRSAKKDSLVGAFANEDGIWYKHIVTKGYSYGPDEKSPLAFFPLYPLLAAYLLRVTGLAPEVALLIVSHTCLAASFVLTAYYVRQRSGVHPASLADYALLSLGLMPATLFFRMTYSESLFILLSVLALLAMIRRWPLLLVAFIVGLATASRPVGVGLLVPFLLHCWHRSSTRWGFVLEMSLLLPIACWGIGGYALYQGIQFGEPLAFVKTQSHWGRGTVPLTEKLFAALAYEPIWEAYTPSSPAFWGRDDLSPRNPLFCWSAVNPVYFVLTVILIVIGAYKRWLSSYELTLAVSLLLISYFTRGYEMAMASQARFAAAVFPVYIVLGNILARLPGPLPAALLGVSAFYLGIFSALFATWHLVF